MRRLLLLLGTVIAIAASTATMAAAHAELIRVDPPAGTPLRSRTITLHFTEAADAKLSSLVIVESGQRWSVTPLTHPGGNGTALAGSVPAGVADGPTTFEWRSVSADDGHVAGGSFELTVALGATGGGASSFAPRQSDGGVSGWFAVVRMVSYLSMALLCGGLAFLALVWPAGAAVRRSRLVLWAAWGSGLIATGLGIALEGALASGRGFGSLFDASQLATTLSGHSGTVWAVRALLYLLAAPVLMQLRRTGAAVVRSGPWLVGASAVAVGLLRTPGFVAHASEGSWAWLGSVADLVHLVGVAVWIGGLGFLCLVVLPRRRPDELRRVVPAFSAIAVGAVVAIVIAGAFMSWQLVGSVHALTGTQFGHVLLVKLGIFLAVMGTAWVSRRWVQQQLTFAVVTDGDAELVRPFVWSVLAESALAMGVLAIASVLVNTNPPH
jgi:putative copper export protein/methionine-rich copper-binding protein CopC